MSRTHSLVTSVLLLSAATSLPAQFYGDGRHGALAPVADMTLDTTPNGGVFQFTSIHVPAGITVHLTGTNPAQLLCQGAVDIAGTLEANAPGSTWTYSGMFGEHLNAVSSSAAGPGGFIGGFSSAPGAGPGGGPIGQCQGTNRGGEASHATLPVYGSLCWTASPVYGASLPFDLRGGSGGGGPGALASQFDAGPPASGGGGVIMLFAGGPILVTGSITAHGGDITFFGNRTGGYPIGTGGCGSGGSILLRSLGCVRVSGAIDARGGRWTLGNQAGDGFIRVDGYSACGAPDLTGSAITPAPYVTAMPWLIALEPARIGQTYRVRCASAPGDMLGLYLSFGRSFLPVPPFGVVELDPAFILDLGQFTVPATGHDPLATADIAIPNVPALVGLTAYSQMFNAYATATNQPRLSNVLVTTIGS